jgi:Na+/pantothenate symporter
VGRTATLGFGATVTLLAAYVSTHAVPLISLVGAIAWGGMASTLFAPLFGGMFWKGATRAGAIWSAAGGLVLSVVAFALRRAELLTIHEIYPGVVGSVVLLVVVSRLTHA